MESYEILKNAMNKIGIKSVAADLNLSTSLIYKWCQSKDGPEASGVENPLDRVCAICELTKDRSPINWLCEKNDGYFVENPDPATAKNPDSNPLLGAQEILSEFSGLLQVVSQSIENDQRIDREEAGKIRSVWEKLKSVTETFVVACEAGYYGNPTEK